jgi:hypothetical protein
VFILEHYFASESFTAVREAFHNAYPDREVQNKKTIHRLVTKLGKQEIFVSSSGKTAEITAVGLQAVPQLQQRDSAAKIQYCHWIRLFVHKGVHV